MDSKTHDVSPRAAQLESEIAALRAELTHDVRELDRRARRLLDLRRHWVPVAVVGAAFVVGGAGALGIWLSRRHRARTLAGRARALPARAREIGLATRRFIDHPDRVAPPQPPLAMKVVAAFFTAAAAMAGRRLVVRNLKVNPPLKTLKAGPLPPERQLFPPPAH